MVQVVAAAQHTTTPTRGHMPPLQAAFKDRKRGRRRARMVVLTRGVRDEARVLEALVELFEVPL